MSNQVEAVLSFGTEFYYQESVLNLETLCKKECDQNRKTENMKTNFLSVIFIETN